MTEWRTISMEKWGARNLWPLPSGEIAVRGGLRNILQPTSIVAAQSVRAPGTGEVLHFVVSSTNIIVYDESFTAQQTLALGVARKPRTATFAIAGDQILISSPDFASHHAYLGSGVERARIKSSVNTLTTAIAVPRGLCVAWAGRVVVADGPVLYFSDPGEPRTYVGQNALVGEWSSYIYGLHVSAEGALIVATGNGIWALPEDAAAAGQVVIGVWSKLTDAVVLDYETTATSRGKVWALTRTGVRQVYPDGPGFDLDEPLTPRSIDARLHFDDYREGRLYGGQDGPIVAISSAVWRYHDDRRIFSWWTAPNDSTFDLRGLLQTDRGEELLVTSNRVYRMIGNFDGDETLSSEGATVVSGYFFGRLDNLDTDAQPLLTEVRTATDSNRRAFMSVRGSASSEVTMTHSEQNAAIIGTATWDGGTDYMERGLKPASAHFDMRSHELTLEVGAQRPLSRVEPSVRISVGGAGEHRMRHRT